MRGPHHHFETKVKSIFPHKLFNEEMVLENVIPTGDIYAIFVLTFTDKRNNNTVDPQLSEPRLSELSLIRTPFFFFFGGGGGVYNDIHWNFAVH